MGGVFFFIFLAIAFFIALFFIILSAILIIVWNVKKRKGKSPKKWWLVVPAVLLIINIVIALLPAGYIGFLRYANSSNNPDTIYAESGKTLYWPMGNYEPTTSWFEIDGVKCVRFRKGFSDEPFFLDYANEKLGEPIASLKYKQSDSSSFNNFMSVLLSGSTFSEQNISTVYPVDNDNGFAFYYVKNGLGSGTFCAEDELNRVKAYYADISNYDTQNLVCEYSVYTDDEKQSGKRNDAPYINMEKTVVLSAGTFENLTQISDDGKMFERVEIPEKYSAIDNAAVPGSPIFGFDKRELFAYSKDKMAYRVVDLALVENQVYIELQSGADYINGYPLPVDMSQYIIDNVFTD
ncbi:hypothetical protein LQZ18_01170 [Lachnospiraceae bacterium ZAX-1]